MSACGWTGMGRDSAGNLAETAARLMEYGAVYGASR